MWLSFSISGETRLVIVEGHGGAATHQKPTPSSSSYHCTHCGSQGVWKTREPQMIERLLDRLEDMLAEGAIPSPHVTRLLLPHVNIANY